MSIKDYFQMKIKKQCILHNSLEVACKNCVLVYMK